LPAPVTAFDETALLPRNKRNMTPVVLAVVLIAMLIGGVGVVFAMKSKPRPPLVTREVPEPSASAVAKPAPTPSASASASAKPTPSVTASTSAAASIVPPAGKKLPKDFGWLYVHAADALNTRVFVAGRARGTPAQVLMVPCGKLYVNLAKVDVKGNWRGWVSKGQTTTIPCNGTVGEVTFP
jgi:hypothetical protein